QHVVISYVDGNTATKPTMYINGSAAAVTAQTNPSGASATSDSGKNLFMYNTSDTAHTSAFQGIIDEVRISNIIRSADWVKTEYNNQSAAAISLGTQNNAPLISSVSVRGGVKVRGVNLQLSSLVQQATGTNVSTDSVITTTL